MIINNLQFIRMTIQEEMYFKQELLLSYKIEYPQFRSLKFCNAVNKMNYFYKTRALEYQKYCRRKLFEMSVQLYQDSVANGFPIRTFEAVLTFEITYHQNCAVSLYSDRYEYTGGAHGNTTRCSDTWNLQTGLCMLLKQMFLPCVNYKEYMMTSIIKQIASQIEGGSNIYFEDYQKNVANTFNPKQFYLTPEGMIVYFQQYDIAPYSSGIVEFTFPYSSKTVIEPRCSC